MKNLLKVIHITCFINRFVDFHVPHCSFRMCKVLNDMEHLQIQQGFRPTVVHMHLAAGLADSLILQIAEANCLLRSIPLFFASPKCGFSRFAFQNRSRCQCFSWGECQRSTKLPSCPATLCFTNFYFLNRRQFPLRPQPADTLLFSEWGKATLIQTVGLGLCTNSAKLTKTSRSV